MGRAGRKKKGWIGPEMLARSSENLAEALATKRLVALELAQLAPEGTKFAKNSEEYRKELTIHLVPDLTIKQQLQAVSNARIEGTSRHYTHVTVRVEDTKRKTESRITAPIDEDVTLQAFNDVRQVSGLLPPLVQAPLEIHEQLVAKMLTILKGSPET